MNKKVFLSTFILLLPGLYCTTATAAQQEDPPIHAIVVTQGRHYFFNEQRITDFYTITCHYDNSGGPNPPNSDGFIIIIGAPLVGLYLSYKIFCACYKGVKWGIKKIRTKNNTSHKLTPTANKSTLQHKLAQTKTAD